VIIIYLLKKLASEIEVREKLLYILHEFNRIEDKENINENLILQISETLKNLRIVTINITSHFMKIKESCGSFNSNSNKFYLHKISNKETFKFNKNYLIKMVTDTNFLRLSILKNYYNFSMYSDPFFISLTQFANEEHNEKNSKDCNNSLPVPEELFATIKHW